MNIKAAFGHLSKLLAKEQTEGDARVAAEKVYRTLTIKGAVAFVDGKPQIAADAEKLFAAAGALGRPAAVVQVDIEVAVKAEQLRRTAARLSELEIKLIGLKAAKAKIALAPRTIEVSKRRIAELDRLKRTHAAAKQAVDRAQRAGEDSGPAEVEEIRLREQRLAFDAETRNQVALAESRFKVEQALAADAIAAVLSQIREARTAAEDLIKLETENAWLFSAPTAEQRAKETAADRRRFHIVRDTAPGRDISRARYPVITLESALAMPAAQPHLIDAEFIPLPGQDETEVTELADVLLARLQTDAGASHRRRVVYLRELQVGDKIPNTTSRYLKPDGLPAAGPAARNMTIHLNDILSQGSSIPDPANFDVIPWAGQSVRELAAMKDRWSKAFDELKGSDFDDVARSRHSRRAVAAS
jgi:hypothetical protein